MSPSYLFFFVIAAAFLAGSAFATRALWRVRLTGQQGAVKALLPMISEAAAYSSR